MAGMYGPVDGQTSTLIVTGASVEPIHVKNKELSMLAIALHEEQFSLKLSCLLCKSFLFRVFLLLAVLRQGILHVICF